MKKLFSLILISAIAASAQAKTSYGTECGLIDEADNFELTSGRSIELKADTTLTALQGQQVRASTDETLAMSPQEALAYLIDSSENNDVYYETGIFQGKAYDVILYYPGGNPYGVIFKKGSAKALAHIADSDIICEKSK